MKYYVTTINELLPGPKNDENNGVPHGYWMESFDPEEGFQYSQVLKRWIKWSNYSFYYERLLPLYKALLTGENYTQNMDESDLTIVLSAVCPCCDSRTPNKAIKQLRNEYGGPVLMVFMESSPSEIAGELNNLPGVICTVEDNLEGIMSLAKAVVK
jgi:hypothetical protein